MRIAIVSTVENYKWAGTEEVWAQFAKHALEEGHDVMVGVHNTIADNDRIAELRKLGLKVAVRRPFRPMKAYLLKEKIWSDMHALHEFSPDVVLINSGSLYDVANSPFLFSFCEKLKAPIVFFCHFAADTLWFPITGKIKSFFSMIDSAVFVSQHNKGLAERQLARKIDRSVVIMNGSRLLLGEPLAMPSSDTINLGCVARLEVLWKGYDALLEVLSQDQWRMRRWHLNIYGVGPDLSYIKDLIMLYKLDANVTLHGYISDVKKIWEQNHLMVLASRGEGTPLAVLEAMMCARPVVTTCVGGNAEILTSGVSGWLAETAAVNSFGKMLEEAWKDRDRWAEMGLNAHNAARGISEKNPASELLGFLVKNYQS